MLRYGVYDKEGPSSWTYNNISNCYYNTTYNIYIYPVDSIEQEIYKAKAVAMYTATNSSTYPVFNDGYQYTNLVTTINSSAYSYMIIPKTEGDYPSYISFRNQTNLLTVEKLKTNNITNMDYMFAGCTNLTEVNSNDWNLNKVTSAKDIFYRCNNLK